MDIIEALTLAIFCLNDFLEPNASEQIDVNKLDEKAEEAISKLAALRDQMRAEAAAV